MGVDFQSYSGKNILVTGATGFIGPHICVKLAKLGANVFAIARHSTTIFSSIPSIQFIRADISVDNKAEDIVEKVKPDFTFHLAGLAAGGRDLDLIESTFQSNLLSTVKLLTACTKNKSGRMIIIGSMEEPAEGDSEKVPSSPYAASKWAATAYARMFHKLYNTDLVIARLFMTYGPGIQPPQKLLPYVINSLIADEVPKLGSGNRLIDWVYIEDVVEGLLTLGLTPGINGETLDIGSGNLISIKDFVKAIKKTIGSTAELAFGKLDDRPMEQEKKANSDLTYSICGWKPKFSLEEGLTETVEWYRKETKPAHN